MKLRESLVYVLVTQKRNIQVGTASLQYAAPGTEEAGHGRRLEWVAVNSPALRRLPAELEPSVWVGVCRSL